MAATFLPFTTELVTALGWAILHSFWQALVVFACLRIVLKLWPDARSSTKYNLSFLSLAGIFAWFVITLYQQLAAVKEMHELVRLTADGGPALPVQVPVVYESQQELTWMFPQLEMWFPVLVGLYVAGVGVLCIKLIADLAQLQQIRKRQVLPVDTAWEHYLDKLKLQLCIPRQVKLLISQYVQVPVMIGFLKPVILVPVALFNNLSAEQLEAILLHELAHIKRNDYILNIFQSIVETTLFFNPFVWWISKYIRLEREHCCDDMVIAHTTQPLHYAKALVALEEYRFTTNSMAMAAADDKQHLFYRIKRIMEMKTTHLNYSQKFMAVLIIAVGLSAIAWITPSAEDKTSIASPAANAKGLPAAGPLTDTVPQKVNVPNSSGKNNTNAPSSDEIDVEADVNEDMKDVRKDMEAAHKEMRIAHEQMRAANEASQKAVSEAMKNIDWKKINEQTQQALKAVDWKKINEQIETSMKSIDWNKINADINASLKESKAGADPEMIRKSVELGLKSAQSAMAGLDLENIIKESMAHAQRGLDATDREIMREKMNEARKHQRDDMRESREEMRVKQRTARNAEMDAKRAEENAKRAEIRAKAAQQRYKALISQLSADKLIDPSKPFSIEKKNDDLYINGSRQPASVMNKYRPYLGAEKIQIKGEKDNLQVNIDSKDEDDEQ